MVYAFFYVSMRLIYIPLFDCFEENNTIFAQPETL